MVSDVYISEISFCACSLDSLQFFQYEVISKEQLMSRKHIYNEHLTPVHFGDFHAVYLRQSKVLIK